jgi:hypothetical protein
VLPPEFEHGTGKPQHYADHVTSVDPKANASERGLTNDVHELEKNLCDLLKNTLKSKDL